jgi:hypothetical protein
VCRKFFLFFHRHNLWYGYTILSHVCYGDYKTGFGLTTGFIGFWYNSCLHLTNHLKHTDWCSLSRFLQWRTSLCTDPLDWVYISTATGSHLWVSRLSLHSPGTRTSCRPTHNLRTLFSLTDFTLRYDLWAVGQWVLVSSPIWVSQPVLISDDIYSFIDVGRPLWWEIGSVICISKLNCFSSVILLLALPDTDCLWSAFFTSKRHKPSHHIMVAVHGEGTDFTAAGSELYSLGTDP